MLRLKKWQRQAQWALVTPLQENSPESSLSVRSASWTTVIVPSIYDWRKSPQTVILPLSPVRTDPKDLEDLLPRNSPFHPCPFSVKCGLLHSTFVCRVFDPLNHWVLGLQVCVPTPALLSFVLFVLFFWLLGMVPARQALCQIHPNTRPGELLSRLW